jgi:ubiquinone/menaquinone biosynthesis C-methylase UbiE
MKIFFISSLFFLFSCSHQAHDNNHANKHMHKSSHEELVLRFEDPERDLWQKPELVMKLISPLKDQTVIDIGVGSGYFSAHLLVAGAKVTGADVDEKFLEFCRKRFSNPSFRTLKIAYDDPRMAPSSFDMAFTSNTYHHIENRVDYLKKVGAGLKASGRLVILDFKAIPEGKSKFGPPQSMRLSAETVIAELQKAGFEKISVNEKHFSEHYMVIATK